jgi:hypothetical protein
LGAITGPQVNASNITANGTAGTISYAILNAHGLLDINNSTLTGTTAALFVTNSGNLNVGASWLNGSVTVISGSTAVCVSTYKANYTQALSNCT